MFIEGNAQVIAQTLVLLTSVLLRISESVWMEV